MDTATNEMARMELDWDYMQELLSDAPGNDGEGFTIDTDRKAEWAAKTIKKEMADTDRLLALADEEIRALHDKKAELANRAERRTAYLREQLRGYFGTVEPSRTTKTQTVYELVNAKLVLKKQGPEYVRDEEAMIAWAEENAPDYIRNTPKIMWGDLKKATALQGEQVIYAETGEVIPGIKAVPREDVFEVQ